MTSIFSNFYLDNLHRVNSSPNRVQKESTTREGVEKSFSKVLADLEHKDKTSIEVKELPNKQTIKPDAELGHNTAPLSNLTDGEQAYARARLAVPTESGSGILTENHESNSVKDSVKDPPIPVKVTAPAPILPTIDSPPQVPRIISAKRVYGGDSKVAASGKPSRFELGEIRDIVTTAGKYHGVDPTLSLAVAEAESAFRHDAVSSDGHQSKGVFQLLDSTGRQMMNISGMRDSYDPFDPGMNAFLGVGYLRRLMDMFKSSTKLSDNLETTPAKSSLELEKLAVAAFNAGEGSVVRAQERAKALGKNPAEFASIEPFLPSSTREYVQKVARIRANLTGSSDDIEKA